MFYLYFLCIVSIGIVVTSNEILKSLFLGLWPCVLCTSVSRGESAVSLPPPCGGSCGEQSKSLPDGGQPSSAGSTGSQRPVKEMPGPGVSLLPQASALLVVSMGSVLQTSEPLMRGAILRGHLAPPKVPVALAGAFLCLQHRLAWSWLFHPHKWFWEASPKVCSTQVLESQSLFLENLW